MYSFDICVTFSLQSDGMDEVTFQNLEGGCVRDKEPTHLPLGCSIRNLVKVRGILFCIKGSACAPIPNLALN